MARGAILIIHLIIASSENVIYNVRPSGTNSSRWVIQAGASLRMMGNEQQLGLPGELIHLQNGAQLAVQREVQPPCSGLIQNQHRRMLNQRVNDQRHSRCCPL